MKKELSRRSGVRIAAELMKLLGGRLSAVMLLAVLNGSLGFQIGRASCRERVLAMV